MHVERTKKGVGEWNSQEEYNLAGIPRQNPKILEVQCAATQLQYRFTINNDIDSHSHTATVEISKSISSADTIYNIRPAI